MLDALRRLAITLTVRGGILDTMNKLRRLMVLVVKAGPNLSEHIESIGKFEKLHAEMTGAYIGADAIREGRGGAFDAADLRIWLALAERADVPAIEAREILSLTEAEMSVASGTIEVPDNVLSRRFHSAMKRHAEERAAREQENDDANVPDGDEAEDGVVETEPDRETVLEKLAAAMDDVPEGWMVRHVRSGPAGLKGLVGIGASGPDVPEVRFDSNLEIGPGWVRMGNRRRVDAADNRMCEHYAHGPAGADSVFVARPWMTADRWVVGEDPHRHGSQFAGKGCWPIEWRALVENGRVVGVANYYGWVGEASPENAAMALKVRELAQKVVDEGIRIGARPAWFDVDHLRDHPKAPDWLQERFPADGFNCTLDFMEVRGQGLMLLEGGPAFFYRMGGGHPCAFAGIERPDGVAFKTMPGVLLGDPKTWKETDRTGCILSWSEVEALAASNS